MRQIGAACQQKVVLRVGGSFRQLFGRWFSNLRSLKPDTVLTPSRFIEAAAFGGKLT